MSGRPEKGKSREIASGLAGAIFAGIFVSLFWAWMMPERVLHQSELRGPFYYGGYECYGPVFETEPVSPK